MRESRFILAIGAFTVIAGFYLTPDKWGYGLVGFGFAHLVLGMLGWLRKTAESDE